MKYKVRREYLECPYQIIGLTWRMNQSMSHDHSVVPSGEPLNHHFHREASR